MKLQGWQNRGFCFYIQGLNKGKELFLFNLINPTKMLSPPTKETSQVPDLILPTLKRRPTSCILSPLSGYEIKEAVSFKPSKLKWNRVFVSQVVGLTRVMK